MTIRQIRLTAAITLISISSLLSQAQNYVIYHVTGNAYTLNNTKATPVTKGKTVKGSTLLRIDTKGEGKQQTKNNLQTPLGNRQTGSVGERSRSQSQPT